MSFDRLEGKVDKCLDKINSVDKTQQAIEVDLRHHIKRTDMLEKKTNKIWYLILLGAGAGIAQYGTSILKILGLIL